MRLETSAIGFFYLSPRRQADRYPIYQAGSLEQHETRSAGYPENYIIMAGTYSDGRERFRVHMPLPPPGLSSLCSWSPAAAAAGGAIFLVVVAA